jgi:mRNA interferase MazF
VERGEVRWFEPGAVEGSEQSGRRPAVVLSRDAINRTSPVVIVLPLTTYHGQRLYPSDVLVRAPEAGLRVDSVALGLQLRAIDRRRLSERLGRLAPPTLARIEDAVLAVLDIER